ncbi:uncharacterized protein L969DRAFT_96240 [Mixia osmundae IAM 14324]|uniref:NADH dehydrogenase [ubiquinone] 1 alpha subcomplex subunit n=1 Tax=Mixia osmundae (strain CBS 9802 / IAM 14324 / JCM 22182 / KY 12970) TaxID=764103 RepID=G7E4U9_MIXOS|nr:uncharacterized protein L969DRAFT_96240 [Mixia osmundae IAM 14324]KEI37722.1 hypothetical protein L969DRAFT_96240 [Mixia osmundae IAM 14324]GAA97859.1 hypothetical protein E5Q_04539 [Mixia osmundae IAM 14324]
MSLARTIKHFRAVGFREWFHQMMTIGDAKSGKLAGIDQFGNKYYENTEDEVPGRHRWVDYSAYDFNGSQVPPEWHSWLNHIRTLPPDRDPVVIASRQAWQTEHFENLTGTRGAYKPYSSTGPKIIAWKPEVAKRK